MSATIHITRAGQGKHYLIGADPHTVKVSSASSGGRLLAVEVSVAAGGGPPVLHRHDYAEIFYFFEGSFEITTADEDLHVRSEVLGPGDVLAIPSMVWHNFKNVGASAGRFLVIHSPAVMEALFEEVGISYVDSANPPLPAGPQSGEEMQKFLQAIGRYMEFLPPEKLVQE